MMAKVSGCSYRQEDIVHFETSVDKVIEKNTKFVFYDRNATLSYSLSFTDLAMLKILIAWDLITETPRLDGFCKYFFNNYDKEGYVDSMARRQA